MGDGHRLRPSEDSEQWACRRCRRPGQPPDHPASLAWEPVLENEQIVALICPDRLTHPEQRAIRHDQAGVARRLKRGLQP